MQITQLQKNIKKVEASLKKLKAQLAKVKKIKKVVKKKVYKNKKNLVVKKKNKVDYDTSDYSFNRPRRYDENGKCTHQNVQQYTEICLDCGKNIYDT